MLSFSVDTARHFSYSQCAEDLIARRILSRIHIDSPRYLDIGANHPVRSNNTYRFYEDGCSGVLVEPDPTLADVLKQFRPRDTILQCGIGAHPGAKARLHIMSNNVLNTFSEAEARQIESQGKVKIEQVLEIDLLDINEVMAGHFQTAPDFVSLDVEGLDLQILLSLNFQRFRPKVFCVETITFTQDNNERKRAEIIDLLEDHGYMVYADTYINSVFVDKDLWRSR